MKADVGTAGGISDVRVRVGVAEGIDTRLLLVGCILNSAIGFLDGIDVGLSDRFSVGAFEGFIGSLLSGVDVGNADDFNVVGLMDGAVDGPGDGLLVGGDVGVADGGGVGCEGANDGAAEGLRVGRAVGMTVGLAVGAKVEGFIMNALNRVKFRDPRPVAGSHPGVA